ncbi:putative xylanase/chitin deacetylase [Lachnospiraceae bacterium JC7]|nr:putative xylanase/chitin deacetylase [Lachnospiraceae bacterium JC7]
MSQIILKFDDLNTATLPYFQSLHEHCKSIGVPVCFGLIGESLNKPNLDYITNLLKMQDEGVELWNHGYYHTEVEFSSASAQQQKESIQLTQELIRQHLGRHSVTFGSPHNNSTEMTVGVLSEFFPEIKNYFYMVDGGGASSARQLLMRCNYEITTGVVDLDFFKSEYNRIKAYPYFVMQGHPSFWRDQDFDRFKEMLAILKNDGNEFVTAEDVRQVDITGYANKLTDFWNDKLENFYAVHDKVFYYGAGEIGREVYRFMSLRGFKPDGFIVSDGKRDVPEVCGVPVFELSEIKTEAGKCGIVPTILGRTHRQILSNKDLSSFDIWMPGDMSSVSGNMEARLNLGTEEYDRFIDYVRYELSLCSWKQ